MNEFKNFYKKKIISNKIAIIILNLNGIKWLKKFIPDIKNFSKEADIYIIDNASKDNSINYIEKNYPIIKIIKHSKNLGFSEGYNKGIEKIDAKILCLINSDVQVSKDWLKPIIPIFNNNYKLGALQPKILNYKNKKYFEYAGAAGGFIDNWGYPYCRGRIFNKIEMDIGQYEDTCEIFWASGACFFIRKSVYKKIGGFDKNFFAHMEEIDLCWRLKNKGYKIIYTSKSKVYHIGGETLNKSNPKKTFLNFRNNLLMLSKNLPLKELYKVLIIHLFIDIFGSIYFLFKGKYKHSWAIIKAHLYFYKSFYIIYKKRYGKKISIYFKHKNIFFQYFIMKRKYFNKLH